MRTTIPRAEIQAIAEQHGISMTGLPECLTVDAARKTARLIRDEASLMSMAKFENAVRRVAVTQAADDLDALADRYEQEAQHG